MSALTGNTKSASWLTGISSDLRATCRALVRRPAFAFTAILTLALGIGASTSVFAVVDTVLLQPLPYANPERLVALWPDTFNGDRELVAVRERTHSFQQIAAFSPGWLMTLTEVELPRQLNAALVSANMFTMLGARPMLGRVFDRSAENPGNDKVAVLGYELWRTSFHGDSTIVGRSVHIGNAQYTVLGVMPKSFQLFDWKSDLWMPFAIGASDAGSSLLYGRLEPGSTVQSATNELTVLAGSVQKEFGRTAEWVRQASVVSLNDSVVGGIRPMLWLLFGGVLFLLLIATTNVANLLLVRAVERRGELALRLSLGAPMWRIARFLMSESLVLAATGGALGVVMAFAVVNWLGRSLPEDLPRRLELHIALPTLAFGIFVSLAPAVAFGLAPLLRRFGLAAAIRDARAGQRMAERSRGALVSLEIALALVLMIGTAVMGRSMLALMAVDVGMQPDHLLTAQVQPPTARDSESVRVFWHEAIARIEATPGVVSAGTVLHLPMSGRTWMADIKVEGVQLHAGALAPKAAWQSVSSHYFAAAGVPLLSGRAFSNVDRSDSPPVVIVNASFASRYFRDESPLGKRISAGRATNDKMATIVGVVGSVRHDSLNSPPSPEVYVPIDQKLVGATALVVRTVGDPVAIGPAVRGQIRALNSNTSIDEVRSMTSIMSASLARPRLLLAVLATFAITGMMLGVVGIYGVVAYGVQQRRRELGIRSALGADAGMLRRMVIRSGLQFAIAGVAAGIPAAAILSRALRGFLYEVSPVDPLSFGVISAGVVAVAVAASWLPARNAARGDMMRILREE